MSGDRILAGMATGSIVVVVLISAGPSSAQEVQWWYDCAAAPASPKISGSIWSGRNELLNLTAMFMLGESGSRKSAL